MSNLTKSILKVVLFGSIFFPDAFSQVSAKDCLFLVGQEKRLLKSILIGIDTPAGSGSGVVIGKKGDRYTALTAKHVYKGSNLNEIEIYSPTTKQYYPALSTSVIAPDEVDIGLIQFRSKDKLPIAILNYNLITPPSALQKSDGIPWGVLINGGHGAGVSMPSGAITVPVVRYTNFALQERVEGNLNGYEMIYESSTVPGMSGGPIVSWRQLYNKGGNSAIIPHSLIAIHGRSEDYISGGRSGMSLAVPVDLAKNYLKKNADNLGIPRESTKIVNLLKQQYCD